MKNLFIYISLLVVATTLGYALAPVTVVLNNDGDNLTAQLNDYSSGSAVAVGGTGTITVPTVTANGSGYSTFVVGEGEEEWENFDSDQVNSNMLVEIFDDGDLVAQFRLDELQEVTARFEQLPSDVTVGDELKVEGDSKFEGDATFKGESTFKGETTFNEDSKFKGKVNITGVLKLKSNEFEDTDELGDITSNIMVFVGEDDIEIEEDDFSGDLVNGATYTIVNNGDDYFSIELDNGGYREVYVNQVITIIRIGGNLYYVSTPGFGQE